MSPMKTLILTGTPVLNSPLDLHSQLKILSREVMPMTRSEFREHFFYDANERMRGSHNYFPKWIPREDRYPDLQAILDSCSMRVLKADCLDLPPIVRKRITVPLTTVQEKMYCEMAEQYVAVCPKNKSECTLVTASIALEKSLRLQEICNGIVSVDGAKHKQAIDSQKYEALKEILEDHFAGECPEKKLVIWSCWKATYGRIAEVCDSLSLGFTSLTGEDSAKEKREALKYFTTDARCRVLIANQQAGGTGIDGLQVADTMIYFAKNYNLEGDLQSEARLHRAGQKSSVTRIDIECRGTVEEDIGEALLKKLNAADLLLNMRRRCEANE